MRILHLSYMILVILVNQVNRGDNDIVKWRKDEAGLVLGVFGGW